MFIFQELASLYQDLYSFVAIFIWHLHLILGWLVLLLVWSHLLPSLELALDILLRLVVRLLLHLIHVLAAASCYLLILSLHLLLHLGLLLLSRHHLLLDLCLVSLRHLTRCHLTRLRLLAYWHLWHEISSALSLQICIACLHLLLSLLLIALMILHRALIRCSVLPLMFTIPWMQVLVELKPIEMKVFPLLGVFLWKISRCTLICHSFLLEILSFLLIFIMIGWLARFPKLADWPIGILVLNPVMIVAILLEVVYFTRNFLNFLTLIQLLLLRFGLTSQLAVLVFHDLMRFIFVVVFDFHVF